jgi:hypothetical protein
MLPRLDPDDEEVASDEEARARDRRVIGTFVPGESSPVDVQELQSSFNEPSMHVQAQLKVDPLFGKPTRFVWIQFLLDSKLKESRSVNLNSQNFIESPSISFMPVRLNVSIQIHHV